MSHALVLVSAVVLLAACGGESSGADSVAIVGGDANEAAYQEAYAAAWVKSCKAAVAKIRNDAPNEPLRCSASSRWSRWRATRPSIRASEGRRPPAGHFDGCAYAWDEAYAAGGEVEARC